jgi:YesN/AraC family two-component response regulator
MVLMDIKMPKKNGFEVIEEIRSVDKLVPIIVQSAFIEEKEIKKSKELGVNNYIKKPIDKDELIDAFSHNYNFEL